MSAPNEITGRVLNWIRRERLDRQAARIVPHQLRSWVETQLVGSLDRETGQEFTNPHYEGEHSDALKAAARLGLKHVDWSWIRRELYSRATGAISLKEQDADTIKKGRESLDLLQSGEPCWWNPKLPKDPDASHQAGWVLDVRQDANDVVWYALYTVEQVADHHVILAKREDTTPREALTVRHVIPEQYHQVRPEGWHDLERIPGASLEPTVDPSVRPAHEMAGDAAGAPGEPSPEAIAARERKRAQVEWDDRMAALNRGLFGPLGFKWSPPNLWTGTQGPLGNFAIKIKPPVGANRARIVWAWVGRGGATIDLGEFDLLDWAHGFLLCAEQYEDFTQAITRLGGASDD